MNASVGLVNDNSGSSHRRCIVPVVVRKRDVWIKMMKHCWAAILGGCSKKISKEHYIGQDLFQKLRTRGVHNKIEGIELPSTALQANILCKNHNNLLSDTDQEAIQLHKGLRQWFENEKNNLKGDGLWTPTSINIDGSFFCRWLCKFHCNLSTLKDISPAEYYIRSAFGQQTDPEPRVYVRLHPGDRIIYEHRIRYKDYFIGWTRPNEFTLFHVYFMGLDFLVCPFDLTNDVKNRLAQITGSQFFLGYWIEKPNRFVLKQGDIQTKSLSFNW